MPVADYPRLWLIAQGMSLVNWRDYRCVILELPELLDMVSLGIAATAKAEIKSCSFDDWMEWISSNMESQPWPLDHFSNLDPNVLSRTRMNEIGQRFDSRKPILPIVVQRPCHLIDGHNRRAVALERGIHTLQAVVLPASAGCDQEQLEARDPQLAANNAAMS